MTAFRTILRKKMTQLELNQYERPCYRRSAHLADFRERNKTVARTLGRPLDTLLRTTGMRPSVGGQHDWSVSAQSIPAEVRLRLTWSRFRAERWQDNASFSEIGRVGEGFATVARKRSAPEVEEECTLII